MAYGFKSRTKSASRSYRRRGSSYGSFAKKFGTFKRTSRRPRMIKFATVGFTRNTERKYCDKAMAATAPSGTNTGLGPTVGVDYGFSWTSDTWAQYKFAFTSGLPGNISNDMLKGLGNGAGVRTRIGNKITCKYLKGSITVSAAKQMGPSSGATNGDQNGESIATASSIPKVWQYLRTTFRIVIVKDTQVNSTDTKISWPQVFETADYGLGVQSGVHAELNIANMGRFIVLSDRLVKTDAVCPQETIKFMIPGSKVGNVRYNGSDAAALTDKGVYVIWAAFTSGVTAGQTNGTEGMAAPEVVMHSRLCFTDD